MTTSSSSRPMSGGSPRDDGAPQGPVDAYRAPLAISGWLYPGGGAVRAPVVGDPFWRGRPGGGRHSLGEVIAGQGAELRRELLDAHAAAVGEIARAAAAAKAAGEDPRALVSAASRLLRELIGQA